MLEASQTLYISLSVQSICEYVYITENLDLALCQIKPILLLIIIAERQQHSDFERTIVKLFGGEIIHGTNALFRLYLSRSRSPKRLSQC